MAKPSAPIASKRFLVESNDHPVNERSRKPSKITANSHSIPSDFVVEIGRATRCVDDHSVESMTVRMVLYLRRTQSVVRIYNKW